MASKFHVEVTVVAKDDIRRTHDIIADDKPVAAARWARKAFQIIKSLKTNPHRYEEIPEAEDLETSYRHVTHGNYRIIYRIDEKTVTVMRVLHGAKLLRARDIERLH